MKKIVIFILAFSLLGLSQKVMAENEPCFDWGKIVVQYDVQGLSPKGPIILVKSFQNFTGKPGDDWLSQGIRLTITDLLKASNKDVSVITGLMARYHPRGETPDFTIEGSFQHLEGNVRIFPKLLDRSGNIVMQSQLDTEYGSAASIFGLLYKSSFEMLKKMDVSAGNPAMESVRDATRSFDAFMNYVKGRLAFFSFDINKMTVAKIWFEESKKSDFRYINAYKGLIDMYTFMGFYNKQYQRAYSAYYEKANEEIAKSEVFLAESKVSSKKKKGKKVIVTTGKESELQNRFLLSNAHFIAGLHAANSNNWEVAIQELNNSLKYVPEDGITYYHLYQVYTKMNQHAEATSAYNKASEINKCLGYTPEEAAPARTAPAKKQTTKTQQTQPTKPAKPVGQTKPARPPVDEGDLDTQKKTVEPEPTDNAPGKGTSEDINEPIKF